MGKGKRVKDRNQVSNMGQPASEASEPRPSNGTLLTAADGRNIEGWSAADVSTYNELLHERTKLEKEKNELEYKAERRCTERELLHQTGANLDRLFSRQVGGDYKYTGWNACCLDMRLDPACTAGLNKHQISCKHEICTRAKKTGITWMEMDTIKYYEMRIFTEKSERKQNALRKQREVELIRVKKAEDEENAAKTRKMALLDKADREALRKSSEQLAKSVPGAMVASYQQDAVLEAAKQNDSELSHIRDELEDIRRQIDAGKVTSGDLRAKLDLAQSKMVEAERRNNLFRQMILEVETVKTQVDTAFTVHASLDDDLKKLCATAENAVAQAMTLMKDFFSASGPDQMEETMSRLKTTLEARGPMPKYMRDSFRELEAMVSESKAKGLKMDFKVDYGGAITGNSMADTMRALREKMKDGTTQAVAGPELKLDKELVQANQGCLHIEEAAEKEMEEAAERHKTAASEKVLQALTKIKTTAVAKSPIPPLSDIMLEARLQHFVEVHNARLLLQSTVDGATGQEIAGRLTSLILSKAQNSPDKLLSAFSAIANSMDIASLHKVPESVKSQLLKVERRMQAWVEKHVQSNYTRETARSPAMAPASAKEAYATKISTLSMVAENAIVKVDSVAQFQCDQEHLVEKMHKAAMASQNSQAKVLSRGIKGFLAKYPEEVEWTFRTYSQVCHGHHLVTNGCVTGGSSLDILRLESQEPLAMLNLISVLYNAGCCPGQTVVYISRAMTDQARTDHNKLETDMHLLAGLVSKKTCPSFDAMWFTGFSFLAGTMCRFFTNVVAQLEKVFDNARHASIISADTMKSVISAVVLRRSQEESANRIHIIRNFICAEGIRMSDDLDGVLYDLERMLHAPSSICSRPSCPCSLHGTHLTGQQSPSLMPAPLRFCSRSSAAAMKGSVANSDLPTAEAAEMPVRRKGNSVTTIRSRDMNGSISSGNLLRPHFDTNTAKTLYELATMGEGPAAKSLKLAQLQLRAYDVAMLDPPLELLLTIQGLITVVYGAAGEVSEVCETESSGIKPPAYDSEGDIMCTCEECVNHLAQTRPANTSKFVEHFDSEGPTPKKILTKKEKRKATSAAKKRCKEVIEGKTDEQYIYWTVQNLLREAQSGLWRNPLEPFQKFETFFTSVGPIPKVLKATLDLAKAHLAKKAHSGTSDTLLYFPDKEDIPPIYQEIDAMMQKVSTLNEPFVSDEEWQIRKLAFYPDALLTDQEFEQLLAESSQATLEQEPDSFDNYVKSIITAFENGGAPVGKHFHETVNTIKKMAKEGEYRACDAFFKDLARMMVVRWRQRSIELPEEDLLEGRIAIEKIREEKRKKLVRAGKLQPKKGGDYKYKAGNGADGWREQLVTFLGQPWEYEEQVEPTEITAKLEKRLRYNKFANALTGYLNTAEDAKADLSNIPEDAEHYDSLVSVTQKINDLSGNIILAAREIAKAQGWNNVVEEVDRVMAQAAEEEEEEVDGGEYQDGYGDEYGDENEDKSEDADEEEYDGEVGYAREPPNGETAKVDLMSGE